MSEIVAVAGKSVKLFKGHYTSDKSVDGWLNRDAFESPTPDTLGNFGRNNLQGPGAFQVDVGLSRPFTIREGQAVQLRAEAFNLPNHLNPNLRSYLSPLIVVKKNHVFASREFIFSYLAYTEKFAQAARLFLRFAARKLTRGNRACIVTALTKLQLNLAAKD